MVTQEGWRVKTNTPGFTGQQIDERGIICLSLLIFPDKDLFDSWMYFFKMCTPFSRGPPQNGITQNGAGGAQGTFGIIPGQLAQLAVNATALCLFNGNIAGVKAIGLITCAAVIYFSSDPMAVAGAWVHHANTGHVNAADVAAASQALGGPLHTLHVVFAHPNAHDAGYQGSVDTIIAQGVLPGNIIEIEQLQLGMFGVDNQLRLGS